MEDSLRGAAIRTLIVNKGQTPLQPVDDRVVGANLAVLGVRVSLRGALCVTGFERLTVIRLVCPQNDNPSSSDCQAYWDCSEGGGLLLNSWIAVTG
jgi:hypothetical protein